MTFCLIPIIAILAGMLLPALNKARESGRTISCSSLIKQFHLLSLHYSEDNNDWCAGGKWRRELWPYISSLKYDGNYAKISQYNTYRCPTMPSQTTAGKDINLTYNIASVSYDSGYACYGYAQKVNGEWTRKVRSTMAKAPSQKGYAAEWCTTSDYVVGWGEEAAGNNLKVWLPHSGKGNLSFLDGHVETGDFKPVELKMDTDYRIPLRQFNTNPASYLFRVDENKPWR